ncbi:MAG: hypothetical protein RLP44_06320 [Aggregatilineales bacterium]
MAKKTWTFKLGGRKHQVAVAHMPATGKGGIWVNGTLHRQKNIRFENGSVHHFYLGEYALAIYVREHGYDLTINGISLDLLRKRRATQISEADTRQLAEIGAGSPSLVRQVMAKRQQHQSSGVGISKLLDTNTVNLSTRSASKASVAIEDTPAWSIYDDTPTDEAPARPARTNRFNNDPLISTQPLEDDTPAWAYAEDDYDPFADDDAYSSDTYGEKDTDPAGFSGGGWFDEKPLFANDVFAEEAPKSVVEEEKSTDNKSKKKNSKPQKSNNATSDATPIWAWLFVAGCMLVPIVSLGGAIPGAVGFGGAAGVRQVARDRSMPVELRVFLSAGIVVICWAILILLAGGFLALTESGLFAVGS